MNHPSRESGHVTVVVPTYNRAQMIVRSLDSALAQTYGDLDVVVVDDGSTDNTSEVVQSIGSDRLRYHRLKSNFGAQVARNAGVRLATGEFIAFLDSDDEWSPEKITIQVAKITACPPEVGMVYCGIRRIDQDGRHLGDRIPRYRGDVFERLLKRNIIGGMSVALIRADALAEIGPFDERLRARQDLDMWLRIARRYMIDYVPEKLVTYHVHRGRTSENKSARLQGTLALLGKLSRDLRNRPGIRAHHLYALARLYRQTGEYARERLYLRRSLAARVGIRSLVRYGLSFTSRVRDR